MLVFPYLQEHMTQQASTPRVYLADLTIQPTKVAVCVRVMRKWSFNGNEPGAAIRYIGLVLADEKVHYYSYTYRF
jgi:hypothetical protein